MKTQTVMLGLTAAFSLVAFGEELPTNGARLLIHGQRIVIDATARRVSASLITISSSGCHVPHLEKGVFINCYVTQSEVSSAETPRGAP